jgi:hypothetical protein
MMPVPADHGCGCVNLQTLPPPPELLDDNFDTNLYSY